MIEQRYFGTTSKSDGCIRKTVSNNLLKKTIPDYKFTNLDEGLYKTYNWFKKIIILVENNIIQTYFQ